MDRVLERRLATMERRVAALELALDQARVARPRAAPPAPPPLPKTGPTPPAPVIPKRPRTPMPTPTPTTSTAPSAPDWERFFGLAVLGRIGVAAVLLAAGYFAQLAYRGLPPLGKVLSIYALGAAFIGVGMWLRPKVAKHFTALLWGGGAASMYLAAIAAHLKYDLVGDTVALGLLVVASGVGHALARTLRHQTLASMALAGAFAAPLIADASLANGPFLMAYLLALHAWSAWIEERWDWVSARIVGVAGVAVVAARWLQLHGAVDVPTLLMVHGYLFGLMAPELFRVSRGLTVPMERRVGIPIALAAAELVVFIVCLGPLSDARLTTATIPLLAGLAWTGMACALIGSARDHANAALVKGLANVGQVLVAIGLPLATRALPSDFALEPETAIVFGLAVVALGALALRRHLGVGDLGAAVATPIACVAAVVPSSAQHVFLLFPVAAATAGAVVVFGKHVAARTVAAWSGLLALGIGIAAGTRFGPQDTLWIAIALVAATAWSWALMQFARRQEIAVLALNGVLQFWVIGWIWTMHAFTHLLEVRVPLFDAMTLAGVIIAAGAAHAAWTWRDVRRTVAGAAVSLWLLALALPVLAGHREMVAAVSGMATEARDAWHVIYFASAGVLLGWIGRGGKQGGRAFLGIGGLVVAGVGIVKTLLDFDAHYGPSAWSAAQVAAALAAPVALAWFAVRGRREHVLSAFALLAASVFAYLLHASFGHLPAETPFLNWRFAMGLLAIGATWGFPYFALGASIRRSTTTTALLAGLTLGFLVGITELWDLVKDLSDAWPAVLISVYMALYAAGTLAVGFARSDKRLRYPALVLFGLVVLKVGLYDLANAATALRIFVTGILGLVLLAAAFAYARRTTPPEVTGVQ